MVQAETPVFSKLWGVNGEKWRPGEPLADFSDVGYHSGKDPIPDWPVGVSVRDFGAAGDGEHDDTEAFRKAIAACPEKAAVFIPNGAYLITDWVRIPAEKNFLVIRGEDMRRTILSIARGLQEIHPESALTTRGAETTLWSWAGGFIWFEGGKEKGIENLAFHFPDKQYTGHFKERGYNAINFDGNAQHCWARNIYFYNCDSGAYGNPAAYVTFENFVFDEFPGRALDGIGGHHGVTFKQSHHCLVDGFVFKNQMFHECCIEHASNHIVWSNGRGVDLHFDHHQASPHHNLWTDIDVGQGTQIWKNNARGSTEGEVYWNIRADKELPYPDNRPTHKNIFVGFQSNGKQVDNDSLYEEIPPNQLQPANLYKAQLQHHDGK